MISKWLYVFVFFFCAENIFSHVIRSADETLDQQLSDMWLKVNRAKDKMNEYNNATIGKATKLPSNTVKWINQITDSCSTQLTQEFKNIEAEARKTGTLQYDIPELVMMRILSEKYPEIHELLKVSLTQLPYPLEVETVNKIEAISMTLLNDTSKNMQDLYDEIKTHQDVWKTIDFSYHIEYFSEEKDPAKYNQEQMDAFSRTKVIGDRLKTIQQQFVKAGQALLASDLMKKVKTENN